MSTVEAKARFKVLMAVRNGQLQRLDGSISCTDCSSPASEYDHRDYLKPLDVSPVCRSCNRLRGPAINKSEEIKITFRTDPILRNRFNKRLKELNISSQHALLSFMSQVATLGVKKCLDLPKP